MKKSLQWQYMGIGKKFNSHVYNDNVQKNIFMWSTFIQEIKN